MKWNIAAGLFAIVAVMDMHAPPPADACGVKLTVKSQAPRKPVARSSNPSDVLLLGTPPRRLEMDLAAAGHRVEVAPSSSAAKKKSYAVVITDTKQSQEARTSFASSVVIVRSGDVSADIRSVEKQVGRQPVRADESRPVVAARPARQPIAAGPAADANRKIVAARDPEAPTMPPTAPTPPAPTPPAPPPERLTTKTTPSEVRPTEPAPPPEPKRPKVVAKVATGGGEVYFGYNSYKVPAATLARTVRWLKDQQDVSVVIEGHADPAGTPEDNMVLAQKRAQSVHDYLVAQGIDGSRLEVISYGDTRLKYGKADPRNRRAFVLAK